MSLLCSHFHPVAGPEHHVHSPTSSAAVILMYTIARCRLPHGMLVNPSASDDDAIFALARFGKGLALGSRGEAFAASP